MSNVKQVLKAAVEEYTEKKVKDIDVHADPKVNGSYAVRATTQDGKVNDFLLAADWQLVSRTLTVGLAFQCLEDAVYETWPPTTGPVKYVGNIV